MHSSMVLYANATRSFARDLLQSLNCPVRVAASFILKYSIGGRIASISSQARLKLAHAEIGAIHPPSTRTGECSRLPLSSRYARQIIDCAIEVRAAITAPGAIAP